MMASLFNLKRLPLDAIKQVEGNKLIKVKMALQNVIE